MKLQERKGTLDLNRDGLILWSGTDENIQESDSVGLIMNKGLKSISDSMKQCNPSCGGWYQSRDP